MRNLCLDVFEGIPHKELLPLVKAAGFDGFCSGWTFGNDLAAMTALADQARALGLTYENSHSTIPGSELMWVNDPGSEAAVDNFLVCLDNCEKLGIPLMVVHVQTQGVQNPDFDLGMTRFERIVSYAAARNIRIAFENIDNPDFLVRTLRHFEGRENVGFCYDNGHEACHTPGVRYLPQVGEKLIYTHLHDNRGTEDDHFIPGDGSLDMELLVQELKDSGYPGGLTLEVNYDTYKDKMSPRAFVERCYQVACELAEKLG